MSRERRYHDEEIREILDLAIGHDETTAQALPAVNGLTLRELQDVGRDVGIPADRIANAVAAFENRGERLPRTTALGLPVTVGRVVPLPRRPTEREWELLITELRSTFGDSGTITSHGSFLEWSHGALHAFIEPTESGYQLRLTNSNGAVGGVALGGFLISLAIMIFVVLLGKEDPGFRFVVPAFFSLFGGGLIAGSLRWAPRWAREQERLMEQIGTRAVTLLAKPQPTDANSEE
jgi:hypothetical protein